jgi:hypothetical protein
LLNLRIVFHCGVSVLITHNQNAARGKDLVEEDAQGDVGQSCHNVLYVSVQTKRP